MNREQKAATIDTLVADIQASDAIFAVDFRGISVPQAAELRTKLREADATFRVVKNSLTERAADQAGVDSLKPLLTGPTALTFVRGDAALAAKAIADYGRVTQLLPFKGGLMDGDSLDAEQIRSISRLPSRDVLYGQLVGVVASPITGLVRTLGALVGGLAVALGQVQEKKESGEIPAGDPPAALVEAPAEPEAPVEAESPVEAEAALEPEAEPEAAPEPEAAATEEAIAPDEPEPTVEEPPEDKAEPDQPAQDDNQADASADEAETADENPKED